MHSVFRPFPLPLTGRQWFYLTFLQGVGAGFIDGGANFGIAYAMYHGQDVVKMWVFSKNTIAGDLGVTPIIQCLASMLITSTLVHSDLHHSAIKPLPYVYPHVEHLPDPRSLLSRSYRRQQRDELRLHPTSSDDDEKQKKGSTSVEKRGLSYYYWMLVRFIFEGTERNMMLARPGLANWCGRFIWTAAQGAGIGIIFGFPIWCLAIVILGPIYGNDNMGDRWAPQVIKLVYGAIVGWITNPVIAVLALGSQADHHLIVVEEDEEEAVEGDTAGEVGVETIPEEEEDNNTQVLAPPASPRRGPPSPRATIPSSPLTRTSPLPTPRRPRASSSASSLPSRPPLTANVSNLSPLPRYASLASPIDTPNRPAYGRERGMTVSSVGSGFSYALGGTGGRAQRPRATTSVSMKERPAVPDVTVTNSDVGDAVTPQASAGRPRAGSWDVFGRRVTAPTGVPTINARGHSGAGRPRSASTLGALGENRESRELDRA